MFELKSSQAGGLLQRRIVLTTLSDDVELQDLAIASSTGAPTLLTATISIAGDDAPSRSPNLR